MAQITLSDGLVSEINFIFSLSLFLSLTCTGKSTGERDLGKCKLWLGTFFSAVAVAFNLLPGYFH